MTDHDPDMLAAEFVLGLLEGRDLADAQSRLVRDERFQAEVAAWSRLTASWLDEFSPQAPPQSAWAGIENQLGRVRTEPTNVVPLRKRLIFWKGLAAGTSAIAASLALVLVLGPGPTPEPRSSQETRVGDSPMVAILESEGRGAAMLATWDSVQRKLIVAAASAEPAASGRSHELWMIPADGKPRSMGVMPERSMVTLEIPAVMANDLTEGVTLAVSDEPVGGSPTGSPTGPVLASGKLQRS